LPFMMRFLQKSAGTARGADAAAEKPKTHAFAKSESVKKPDTPSPDAERYVVQVASLDQEKEALKMVDRLKNKGYPAYHYKIFIKGRSYYPGAMRHL
jgi:cell division septation protein DedD